MTEGKSYVPWVRADDRIVVEEMLRDPQSEQWYECREFVKRQIQLRAKNIPQDHWEDLVQIAMMRVHKYLPTFMFECRLSTWLFGIVRSCIIDAHRKFISAGQFITPLNDSHDDVEHESDEFTVSLPGTVEEDCIIRDELDKAVKALREYLATHANPARNGRILNMVIFEGHSLEEAAKAVGCSAPVAGYVVREAQRYVRKSLGHRR